MNAIRAKKRIFDTLLKIAYPGTAANLHRKDVKENVFYWVLWPRERRCALARSEEFENLVERKPNMDERTKPFARKRTGRGTHVCPALPTTSIATERCGSMTGRIACKN